MNKHICGKTIFSWNIPAVLSGDPMNFARALHAARFEGVCLKAADGNAVHKMRLTSSWPLWGENIREPMIDALRSFGLKIYFWHFLYGADPRGELAVAQAQCNRFQPDGYIWDGEIKFDEKPTAEENARMLSNGLKGSHPDIPQGVCWWALPKNPKNLSIQWHPVKVAKAWMETVDVLMPMMYWGGSTEIDALNYLQRSLLVWDSIGSYPMIPIGRAYTGDAGTINHQAISVFAEKIKSLKIVEGRNICGISWWLLDQAHKDWNVWNTLGQTGPFEDVEPVLSFEEIIDRLVEHHKDLFPEL